MAPKTEIRNKLADALDADLSALSDINIQTYEDVMHTLFLFEEEFDMDIDRTEEKTTLSFDNHNKKIAPLITYLYTWHCNKNLLFFHDFPPLISSTSTLRPLIFILLIILNTLGISINHIHNTA